MDRSRHPAVILGGGSANGLGIARTLGARGIPVYCLTSNPYELTCVSKYCRGYQMIPGVEADPTLLQHALQRLASQFQGSAVLFPTTDTTLLTVSAIRDDLTEYVTYIPPQDVVETFVLKSKFYASLRQHGIPHPRTWDPTQESLQTILAHVTFPVYLRPVQSNVFLQQFRGKGWVAANASHLRRLLQRAARKQVAMLVQDIIEGPTTDGYAYKGYFDHQSRLILFLAFQKIRQPLLFSNCTIHKSIPRATLAMYEPRILTYLTQLGYTGLFSLEFKRDAADDAFKLFDVNARSTADSAMCPACGLNDIFTAYQDALGIPVHPQDSYQSDVYYISELEDLRALWLLAQRRRLTRRDVLPYLRRKQLHLLSRDDPRPLLREVTRLIHYISSATRTVRHDVVR